MIRTLDKGIYNRLAGGTALTAALGGTAIYLQVAPPDASLPVVVYGVNAGGETRRTARPEVDVIYLVKAIAQTPAQAAQIADLIRDRLTDVTLDSPWQAYRVQLTQIVSYVEQIDRRQYWHTGGLYRVRAAVTT